MALKLKLKLESKTFFLNEQHEVKKTVEQTTVDFEDQILKMQGATEVIVAPPVQEEVIVPTLQEMTISESLTSEYLTLYKVFDSIEGKKVVARMEELRKELQSIANAEVEANQPAMFESAEGQMIFSPRTDHIEFADVKGLFHLLVGKFGEDAAFSAFKVAVTELRKLLSDYEIDKIATVKPGSRTLKSVILKE